MFVAFAILIFIIKDYKRFTSGIRAPFLNLGLIREMFPTSLSIALQGACGNGGIQPERNNDGLVRQNRACRPPVHHAHEHMLVHDCPGNRRCGHHKGSHQFGEKRYEDTQKAGFAAMHMAVVFMGICGILYVIFRKSLPYIFSTDPQVVELASQLIIIMATYQVFDAMQLTNGASLRALKDVKLPLLYLCISYYVVFASARLFLREVPEFRTCRHLVRACDRTDVRRIPFLFQIQKEDRRIYKGEILIHRPC